MKHKQEDLNIYMENGALTTGFLDFQKAVRTLERKRIEGVIIKMFHNHKGFGCEYDKALKEVINNIR